MTNKIGEKIKILRKKAGVTQEKFADYLGITFQSVSRWESGICYPDLEILPAIANYFNVTTDELLGVDIMNKQEKIKDIREQLQENFSKGFIDKNIEICRTAVSEFPNDFELLSDLAFYLGQGEDLKESISINERILADCTDNHIRYGVMQKLAYEYNHIGEKEKAVETAKKLPCTPITSDLILADILEGDKKISHLKDSTSNFCDYITINIMVLARTKYNDDTNTDDVEKRIQLYKKAISIYEIIYENGDYGFYNGRMKDLYLSIASNYMHLNDFEKSLDCIEKAIDYAIAFDMLPKIFKHTSLLSEGNEFSKAVNLAKDYDYNESYGILHNSLPNQKYDPIRETERFKAIVAKLEQYAKKET